MSKTTDEYPRVPSTLYVDLDGTFIKSDMLYESFIATLKANTLVFFFCFAWLTKGRSYLKFKLAQRVDIPTEGLPLNPEFHAFLLEEKSKGRKIVLATASTEKYTKSICSDIDLFDSYISSDIDANLKGETKLLKSLEH